MLETLAILLFFPGTLLVLSLVLDPPELTR